MSASTYEIHTVLVLATNHILAEDADLIAGEVFPGKGGDEVSLLVYCGANGDDRFPVETAASAGYSEAFVQALQLARRLQCRYLLFDNAGPTVDELPTFDW
jgi:hypothetical protein